MALLKLLTLPNGQIQTIAVAESLTAGLVCSEIAEESGISAALKGGVCAYNIDAKVNILGVDPVHASSCDCVSETVAKQMAAGVRKLFGSDIGIGTTGYAEAYPKEGVLVPRAYWAITFGNYFITGKFEGNRASDRNSTRRQVTHEVMRALEKFLLNR